MAEAAPAPKVEQPAEVGGFSPERADDRVVTSAKASPKKSGIARQTPRVSVTLGRTKLAKRRLGRAELKPFSRWNDGRPETELKFKFYRQATNKIVGITDETAKFLSTHF